MYILIQTLKSSRARIRDTYIYISYNIVFSVNVHKVFLDVFFFIIYLFFVFLSVFTFIRVH